MDSCLNCMYVCVRVSLNDSLLFYFCFEKIRTKTTRKNSSGVHIVFYLSTNMNLLC